MFLKRLEICPHHLLFSVIVTISDMFLTTSILSLSQNPFWKTKKIAFYFYRKQQLQYFLAGENYY